MSLAEDILQRYLYKENVQELARDRGLPATGPKDEIIATLLESGRFLPAEALAYLNKTELRNLCREYLLPTDGDRDVLFQRVLDAIFAESEPEEEPERTPRRRATTPRVKAKIDQSESDGAGSSRPTYITFGFPESRADATPTQPHGMALDTSREHVESTGPWTVAGIVAGVILVATFYWAVSVFGLAYGAVIAIIVAVGIGGGLLLTAHRWVPLLGGLFSRGSE